MKKVTFLISNDFTFDQRMQKICGTLQSAGFLITIRFPKKLSAQVFPKNGIRVLPFPMIFKRGFLFYLELNHRLFWRSVFSRTEMISAVDLDTLPAAVLLKWIKRVPLILDCHEWYEETPEVYFRKHIYAFWKFLGKSLVPISNDRYTVNDLIALELEKTYSVPFKVIHNYPRMKRVEPKFKEDDGKIIIYQGVLNKDRGLEALIDAMVELSSFSCWLVGDGDIKNKLIDRVDNLGLQERVIFKGKLLPKELQKLTQQAWIGMNLLTGESKSYYYSLANKFFDYMMAGIPSLNMKYPVYMHYMDQYEVGILLESCSPKSIVKAVQELEMQPERYQSMCTAAESARRQFNWENEEGLLKTIY